MNEQQKRNFNIDIDLDSDPILERHPTCKPAVDESTNSDTKQFDNSDLDQFQRDYFKAKMESSQHGDDSSQFEQVYAQVKSSSEQIDNEDLDEFEQVYARTKSERKFSLNIDEVTDSIPNYTGEVSVNRRKTSAFAKIMFAITIVGLSVLLSILIIFSAMEIMAIKEVDRPIMLDIPENVGVVGIADILEEKGVIDSAFIFKAYYKLFGGGIPLNFGTYELNSNMSYDMIIGSMQKYSAAQNEVSVTFPEGITIYEMAKKLEKSEVCTAKEFIDVLNSKTFGCEFESSLTKNPLKFHKMEGFVFPDTYRFYENDTPFNVAKKMVNEFDKKITQEMRDKMKSMGYTLEQTITIASIVQKEAGKTSEMRKVASVYHNRLNNKDTYPNLQACPTRDYANELKSQMNIIDQKIIDAYNTYEDAGLPPGPICNPGIDAIEATLNPEETEYFYFCSGSDGKFYYGKTLQEHERNIRKAGLV